MNNREPDWNAETINRTAGSTDFEVCGWCNHRGGGSYRYNCMLNGTCSLLREYDKHNEVEFDTPCLIRNLGKGDVMALIKSKKYAITECESRIKRANEEIEALVRCADRASGRPPLPENRPHDHFNINDEIMIYISRPDDRVRYLVENVWLSATVVHGYRHHDGCVSACTKEPYHTGDYLDGCGVGMGYAVPTVLLKSEYDYFAENPEDWQEWIRCACKKSYNGRKFSPDTMPAPRKEGAA